MSTILDRRRRNGILRLEAAGSCVSHLPCNPTHEHVHTPESATSKATISSDCNPLPCPPHLALQSLEPIPSTRLLEAPSTTHPSCTTLLQPSYQAATRYAGGDWLWTASCTWRHVHSAVNGHCISHPCCACACAATCASTTDRGPANDTNARWWRNG